MRHTGRLVPVYPETRGLTSRGIRFVVQSDLQAQSGTHRMDPGASLDEFNFPELEAAIQHVHFPRESDEAAQAKNDFLSKNFSCSNFLTSDKNQNSRRTKRPRSRRMSNGSNSSSSQLPFELTPSQKKSLWEIAKDIERQRPMNRLLQGDVGSGKTVVAALAAVIASDHGLQTAFMAPTEILARQHFETMKKLFARFTTAKTPAIGLLTGTSAVIFYERDVETKLSKIEFKKKVASGEVTIIFGTHTLIQKSVSFKALGLVIIDEQHRFGVRQRAELIGQNGRNGKKDKVIPHFLSMSATPIPRTLMLTVFGDLDLSLITELPAGRKEIQTKIVAPTERQATYEFVRRKCEAAAKSSSSARASIPQKRKKPRRQAPNSPVRKNWN